MARSDRSDRLKTTLVAVGLALLAGWALWATSPKPELSSIAWDTPFPAAYVEAHQGRVLVGISESLELFNAFAAAAAGDRWPAASPELAAAFLPYGGHPSVSAARDAVGRSEPREWSGIFAYTLSEEGLVRDLPHTLPAFEAKLAPHDEALASFASASGFREFFREGRPRFEELALEFSRLAEPERIKAWLDSEFPAVSHDALRFVVSPYLPGPAFSHNFVGAGYSEIVVFIPAPGEDAPAASPSFEVQAFVEPARHYVSRMTDRYIRIVNRVFGNISIWRTGSLDDKPAAVFNEYMAWSAYLIYAKQSQTPEAFDQTARAVFDHMNRSGYLQFEVLWDRVQRLRQSRAEPLGALFPRIVREAIQIANALESV